MFFKRILRTAHAHQLEHVLIRLFVMYWKRRNFVCAKIVCTYELGAVALIFFFFSPYFFFVSYIDTKVYEWNQ